MVRKGIGRIGRAGALALISIAAATAALAAEVRVEQPWARASAGEVGAAFMTVVNAGASTDRLVKAASPVAERVELHTHLMEGDIMRMRAVPAIDVPAQGEVRLAPGGLHVMLIGLKAPLKEGETFPLTLSFEHAGTVDVTVPVLSPAAKGAAAGTGAVHPAGIPQAPDHGTMHKGQ